MPRTKGEAKRLTRAEIRRRAAAIVRKGVEGAETYFGRRIVPPAATEGEAFTIRAWSPNGAAPRFSDPLTHAEVERRIREIERHVPDVARLAAFKKRYFRFPGGGKIDLHAVPMARVAAEGIAPQLFMAKLLHSWTRHDAHALVALGRAEENLRFLASLEGIAIGNKARGDGRGTGYEADLIRAEAREILNSRPDAARVRARGRLPRGFLSDLGTRLRRKSISAPRARKVWSGILRDADGMLLI